MSETQPVTVICTYRVQPGKEDEFVGLLEKHWPALLKLGLATGRPSEVFRRLDEPGKTTFVEVFEWVDEAASGTAHGTPEVMAVWEPMGGLVEERGGRPAMEFHHVERMSIEFAEG